MNGAALLAWFQTAIRRRRSRERRARPRAGCAGRRAVAVAARELAIHTLHELLRSEGFRKNPLSSRRQRAPDQPFPSTPPLSMQGLLMESVRRADEMSVFRERIAGTESPYGDGDAATRIRDLLRTLPLEDVLA